MTLDVFKQWLESYGRAGRENDEKSSQELFAPDFRHYVTLSADPMIGREAIYRYLRKGAQSLKDEESSYEILSVKDNLGIARWRCQFNAISSGGRLALDHQFLVEFDEDGKCRLFREWWHLQAVESYTSEPAL
ncbi:MAG TPA: nuclear transport factor 2 family protein [Anaerolineales bacterium]|nr:nuclear transport factor 2 family protein [Anaerolineales bacterium]